MYSYVDHRYPVGFAFIPWHQILHAVPIGGARVQNLGLLHNMIDTMINFLYLDFVNSSVSVHVFQETQNSGERN